VAGRTERRYATAGVRNHFFLRFPIICQQPASAARVDTLEIRPVAIRYRQGEFIVLKNTEEGGVKPGERIIISDVIPVIQGMPLKPIEDSAFVTQFEQDALGRDSSSLQPGALE